MQTKEEIIATQVYKLASRLNVPTDRIGVAYITDPLKLSSTELEPGEIVVYLKPDEVINLDDL